MLEKTELFGQVQFSSCLNIIFGIGLGYIKTSSGSFGNTRDYQDNNSYVSRDYDYRDYQHGHEYYDRGHGVFVNHMHPYMQSMGNSYQQGPLYQYLHHQPPTIYHNYMYHNQEHSANSQSKRY